MSALLSTILRTGPCRGRAPLRLLGITMTVFLVLTVLSPTVQRAAAEEALPAAELIEQVDEIDPTDPTDPSDLPIVDELDDPVDPVDPIDDEFVDAPVDPVGYYINVHECDADYDFDIYQLAANCYEPTIGFEFEAYGPNYTQFFTGDFGADNLEAGLFRFHQFTPQGYAEPIVFCKLSDYLGNDNGMAQVVTYDGYYEPQIDPGMYLYCDWFNTPEHHGGVVTVQKFDCLEALHAEATFDDYGYACTQPIADIEFTLDGLMTGNPGSFLTDQSGTVSWSDREADTFFLRETVPAGYGTPVVFCDLYFPFDEQQPEFVPYDIYEVAEIQFDLEEGQYITCYWFNIPEHEDSSLTVYKYICDENISRDEDLDHYQSECTVAHEAVSFNLTGDVAGDLGTEQTDGLGTVAWDGLESDTYWLDEEIPSGYGEPIVFCGFTAFSNGAVYDGFPVRYDDVHDGTVELPIEIPNSTWWCWYYNIPEHDTSITIFKWLCPADFDLYDDAETSCTEPLNGVEFSVDGPNGYHSQSSTGDAIPYAVRFGGLEEGSYETEETIPAGIDYAFVTHCTGNSNPAPAVYPLYHTDWSDSLNLEIAQGDQVVCHWYNVEEPHHDGTLTIVKYLCSGYVVSELNCEIYRDGQDFVLSAASGEGDPIEFTTGADGTKTLALPEGTWTLKELGGTWCKAVSNDVNGYGEIVTHEGHDAVVEIYNCAPPSKTPPVKLPPVKELPNTGTGPASLDSGISTADMAGQALVLFLVAQALVLIAIRSGGILNAFRRAA